MCKIHFSSIGALDNDTPLNKHKITPQKSIPYAEKHAYNDVRNSKIIHIKKKVNDDGTRQ